MLRAPYFQSNVKYFVQVACFLKFYNSKIFCAGNRVFAVLHIRKPLFGWCRTYWSAPALTFWIKSSLMYPVHVQKNLNKNCPKFEVWSLAHIFLLLIRTRRTYVDFLQFLMKFSRLRMGILFICTNTGETEFCSGGGSKARSWQSFGSATLVFIRIPRFILIQIQRWSRILVQVHLFLSCLYIAFFCI